ncbi:hypothetical protein D3C73_1454780 [compost metagenome]
MTALAVAGQLGVLEVDTLVSVEVGVDLVGGHDAGQRRDIGGDDVAGGELCATDPAADRRGDAGETQIQAGQVQLRLNGGDTGTSLSGGAAARFGQLC